MAFDSKERHGVYVGTDWKTGDVTGDGRHDLIVGSGAGRKNEVRVYDGKSGSLHDSFSPFDAKMTAGVRVASAFVTDDEFADVVVATGQGVVNDVRVFDGKTKARCDWAVYSIGPCEYEWTNARRDE
jgi:hypothetical protein